MLKSPTTMPTRDAPAEPAAAAPDQPPALAMLFPFQFAIQAGGAVLAVIDGYAVLEAADEAGTTWRMTALRAVAVGEPDQAGADQQIADVELPREHFLHDRIAVPLLAAHWHDMDRQWAARGRDKR